jgi:hypothetical protein
MENTTQKEEDKIISIAWKPDIIVNFTMTGKEFEEFNKAINFINFIIRRNVEDNVTSGNFKQVKESDTVKNEKGETVIREDFFN